MVALSDWLPNDWQLAATIVCLILIVLALILSALRRIFVTRAEFARLPRKFEKKSDGVNGRTTVGTAPDIYPAGVKFPILHPAGHAREKQRALVFGSRALCAQTSVQLACNVLS
jgi:hypothetical protein